MIDDSLITEKTRYTKEQIEWWLNNIGYNSAHLSPAVPCVIARQLIEFLEKETSNEL